MHFTLYPLVLFILGATSIQKDVLRELDFQEMGVQLTVPEGWEENHVFGVTRKAHYEMIGEAYSKPDSASLAHGLLYFFDFTVDSTALPAPEAYDYSALFIEMHGYFGKYRRWLWANGRKSLFQKAAVLKSSVNDIEYQHVKVLKDGDARKIFNGVYAVEVSHKKKEAEVGSISQVYFIVKGDRCFRIAIEGTENKFEENRALYNQILASIRFTE